MKIKMLLISCFGCLALNAQQKMTVFFDFDAYTLNADALQSLEQWALAANDVEVAKVYGFCDAKGTNLYNDSLSVRRVKTVADFLKSKRIKIKDGYEIRGFGEDFEQSKVQSENRRVTIVYETRKPEPPKITADENGALPLEEKIKSSQNGEKIKLKDLNFFNMTPRILPRSKAVLYELLCVLQDNPKLKIEIQGHICCQLSGDINNLSVARAKAVYNFLIANKINRNRLSFKGFGTTSPIYPIPEKNEKEEEANRRVEIMILEN